MSNVSRIKEKLLSAIQDKDARAFESALRGAFEVGLPKDLSDILASALVMPWHTRHEDLASALQTLKAPAAVNALYDAALSRHEYLAYDETFGLARKCSWALADIGTPDAKKRLEQLARCPNPVVARYATKRLDSWEIECDRKG